jgi:hypothetical protein
MSRSTPPLLLNRMISTLALAASARCSARSK